jgi:hypothetical protein
MVRYVTGQLCQVRGGTRNVLQPIATKFIHWKGILGQIFTKSQNKIQDPAKLLKVMIWLKEQWSLMGADIKGKIYEGLLEKKCRGHQEWSWTVFLT